MNLFDKDKKNLNVILFYCYEYFCQGVLNSRYIGVTLTLEGHLCTVQCVSYIQIQLGGGIWFWIGDPDPALGGSKKFHV